MDSSVPECFKQAAKAYGDKQNVLSHLVEDEPIENEQAQCAAHSDVRALQKLADQNGEYQMTATEFKEHMEQRYGQPKRTSAGKFWMGAGIQQPLSEQDKWMLDGKNVEEMVSAIRKDKPSLS
jgi:hypothetical protein